jgi:circadian clock protein KaiC
MLKEISDFQPDVAVVDPLSALLAIGSLHQTQGMLLRLIDHLKTVGVTSLFTSLQNHDDQSRIAISSIMDSWIMVENRRAGNDLVRRLHVIKSRGMAHSAEMRRMLITRSGVQLVDLQTGLEGA